MEIKRGIRINSSHYVWVSGLWQNLSAKRFFYLSLSDNLACAQFGKVPTEMFYAGKIIRNPQG
jgi:hypothetical protein